MFLILALLKNRLNTFTKERICVNSVLETILASHSLQDYEDMESDEQPTGVIRKGEECVQNLVTCAKKSPVYPSSS